MKHKIIRYGFIFFLCFTFLSVLGCSSDSGTAPDEVKPEVKTLKSDVSKIDFVAKGSMNNITVTATVASWKIESNAAWIQLDKTTGKAGSSVIKVTASENTTNEARTGIITISSSEAVSVKISVSQVGTAPVVSLYPGYNTNPIPNDATGMTSTAVELAAKMKLGWNIGNTLEAIGGENSWGNPNVSKALIDFVKAKGFNAIRIPCSWDQYANAATAKINETWLNRVKEVVQYCVENDMYVIVNIHWDGGWLEGNFTEAKKEATIAKQKAFWEQIATHLRDFDEHVLFASANEPAVENATQMAILKSYHQTFIDAVRSTGGKNAYRNLVIQGPTTDIEKTNKLMTTLPTDPIANRMMVEVHYYAPWGFAGLTKDETWGKMLYYWGAGYHSATDTEHNSDWGEEAFLESTFKLMKTQFVDKGIPVILGEFGAIRRTNLTGDDLNLHLNSRAYYIKSVVKQAKANGLIPFYWDEGSLNNNGFGIFKRSDNTVFDTKILEALHEGLK